MAAQTVHKSGNIDSARSTDRIAAGNQCNLDDDGYNYVTKHGFPADMRPMACGFYAVTAGTVSYVNEYGVTVAHSFPAGFHAVTLKRLNSATAVDVILYF